MTAFESALAIAGSGGGVGYHPEIRLLPSIEQIPKAAWEQMLPGEPECWDFYRIAESVPPPGLAAMARLILSLLSEATRLLLESRTSTCTAGVMAAPAAVLEGPWTKASLVAGPSVVVVVVATFE